MFSGTHPDGGIWTISHRVYIYQKNSSPSNILEQDTVCAEIIKGIKTGGSLGCSDHILVEFVISRNVGLAESGVVSEPQLCA